MVRKLIPSKNISKLDLSGLGLKEFPLEVLELKNLKKLNLSKNEIKKLPRDLNKLKRLETLDLSFNKIEHLYAKNCELSSLKTLNLNRNKIKSLPRQIQLLKSLQNLLIAKNFLNDLPFEFSHLGNLKKLNLSGNSFQTSPLILTYLKNLECLWINNLPLKNFIVFGSIINSPNLKKIYCYSPDIPTKQIPEHYLKFFKLKGNILDSYHPIGLTTQEKNRIEKIISQRLDDTKMIKSKPIKSKPKVVISYSHLDKKWKNDVTKNLKVLGFQGIEFDYWDDTRINAGSEWRKEIKDSFENADVAVMLISTNFLSSNFIQMEEIPMIMQSAKNRGTEILLLIIGHCRFNRDPRLEKYQAINDPNNPLNTLSEPDQELVLVKLANRIDDLIKEN